MRKLVLGTAISALVTVLASNQVQAVTFTQNGNTGETLSTAQVIPSGSLPLDSISGTISETTPGADLFQIYLTGGKTFSATTATNSGTLADPELFLFDSSGKGVYANDDASIDIEQAILPVGNFSPSNSGIYYLAISGSDYHPVSAEGNIFPDFPDVPFTGVRGPTGAGGSSPLTGFDGPRLNGGSYTITLTGVQTSAQAVPEPASMSGILALGALGTTALLKNKKGKHT